MAATASYQRRSSLSHHGSIDGGTASSFRSGGSRAYRLLHGRYRIIGDINRGSYGAVSLARDSKSNDRLVAVKCINRASPEEAKHEIQVHDRLGKHPNIVELYDSFRGSDGRMYLVMEYCAQGDLYEAIKARRGPGDGRAVLDFMFQLIDTVEYCHSQSVYHRDIKPENILIAADGKVKLADWGLATTERISTDFGVGSERYMAPELFDQANMTEYDAAKADIWSVGICLVNILFERNPFKAANYKDKLFLDFASSREALFDIFPTMSFDVFAVLRHALTIDPDNRSLANMRLELAKVRTWTTDEEELYEEDLFSDHDVDGQVCPSSPVTTTATTAATATPVIKTASLDNDLDLAVASVDDDLIVGTPGGTEWLTTTTNRGPLRVVSRLGNSSGSGTHNPAVESEEEWSRAMQFTPPTHDRSMFLHRRPPRIGGSSLAYEVVAEEDGDEGNDVADDDDDDDARFGSRDPSPLVERSSQDSSGRRASSGENVFQMDSLNNSLSQLVPSGQTDRARNSWLPSATNAATQRATVATARTRNSSDSEASVTSSVPSLVPSGVIANTSQPVAMSGRNTVAAEDEPSAAYSGSLAKAAVSQVSAVPTNTQSSSLVAPELAKAVLASSAPAMNWFGKSWGDIDVDDEDDDFDDEQFYEYIRASMPVSGSAKLGSSRAGSSTTSVKPKTSAAVDIVPPTADSNQWAW